MAEGKHLGQAAAPGTGVGERRDSALDEAILAAQALLDLKTCKVQDSPPENSHYGMDSRDAVDSPSATGNTISRDQTAMTVMGPPAAPASMFWTFEASTRAKDADDRIEDLYIAYRLVAVVVILFRAGNIKYAKVIGQFAVDILGKERWHEYLPPYLNSQPNPRDIEAVSGLLEEVREQLKTLDECNAAYLEGVMATMH